MFLHTSLQASGFLHKRFVLAACLWIWAQIPQTEHFKWFTFNSLVGKACCSICDLFFSLERKRNRKAWRSECFCSYELPDQTKTMQIEANYWKVLICWFLHVRPSCGHRHLSILAKLSLMYTFSYLYQYDKMDSTSGETRWRSSRYRERRKSSLREVYDASD